MPIRETNTSKYPENMVVNDHYVGTAKSKVGKGLLGIGRFLTYPVSRVANNVTKLIGNRRPGKSNHFTSNSRRINSAQQYQGLRRTHKKANS
ncbi:hypothetical protein GZ77_12935 [Endozoicomonas montiporae]|uniref:Uncharacterized protein n=2 Tax=Endozoicomonas montiporae TaxID=1027273 RepID=A0A081N4F3_9GAMM|nr:hypothetical protein [Endozoicomonas montiporae]AMO57827.1 hypothetical protein EZMO1_3885 [Endozoicomonas montiporae CL-33]KEQ13326.1 hypothetical protein GZ77_12935 [Endozoicomonas montiporae]